jgi:hypothetical protein
LELELRFERVGRGKYRVILRGPGGSGATGRFTDPFSDLQLENFALRISRPRGVRSADSPEPQLVKQLGASLFTAVFEDQAVRDAYRSALQEARRSTTPLRVTVALTDTPELLRLPWEYLYDDPEFLAISRWTPVVRRLEVGTPRPPLELALPIRILSLVSAPSDAQPIDASRERVRLTTALAPLEAAGAVSIDWLEEPTLLALTRQLDDGDYHVLHFIGHGAYDESMDDGVLLFEDSDGRPDRVSGEQLGQILRDQLTMRLVVLNACEGARASADDPFSGVATRLIHHGIPSVIGMQFEISDRAAILFASDFYAAIANGRSIDAAMARARRAIYADRNFLEWGTPVLFMRVDDGRLFELAPHDPIPRTSPDALLETAASVGLRVADADAESAAPAEPVSRAVETPTPDIEAPPAVEPPPAEPPPAEPPPTEPPPRPGPEPLEPSPLPGPGPSGLRTSWRRRGGWIAAGVAVVGVATVVALLLLSPFDEPLPGQIAYATGSSGIMIVEPDGSAPRSVPGTNAQDIDPAWTPDGDDIAYRNVDGIWLAPVTTDGAPAQKTFDDKDRHPVVALVEGREVLAFARGPEGTRRIYTLDLAAGDGTEPVPVWDEGPDQHDPAWSPDGEWIAYASATSGGGFDLWKVRGDGSEPPIPITSGPGVDNDPAWSPDGQWIAYASSTGDGDYDLWKVRFDDSEPPVRLTNGPGVDHDPAWSPDGRAIAFSRADEGQKRIFVLRIETGEVEEITSGATDGHPSWR